MYLYGIDARKMVKGDGGSMGRGEASRGSARAGTLGRGGGPRAPGSEPGGRRKDGQQGWYKGSNFPKGRAVAQDQGPGMRGGDGQ